VLVLSFVFLPPISSIAFRALAPCECFDIDEPAPGTDETQVCFLSTDRSVICEAYGQVHHAPPPIFGAAVATVVLWAGVVPLAYAWLLFKARGPLTRKQPPTPLSAAMRFLSDGYEARAYWWELVELGRKLLLVGFMALVSPGSILQLFIGVVAAMCLFTIEIYVRPFDSHVKTFLSLTSGFALVLTLLGTLGLSLAALNLHSLLTTGLMLGVLIFAVLALVVAASCVLAAQLVAEARRPTMRLVATGEAPVLTLPEGRFLAFLSHTCPS
jgi:hypothetical protein